MNNNLYTFGALNFKWCKTVGDTKHITTIHTNIP